MTTPLRWIAAFTAASAVMAVLDLLWLGALAKGFYHARAGHLMASNVRWLGAVLFYLSYGAGIAFFAARPGVESGSILRAAAHGAALGFVVYGAYDFTNLALMKDWPLDLTFVDLAWGVFATAAAAAASCAAAKAL